MLSIGFALALLAVPWIAFTTVIRYYTTGTALQHDPEFRQSVVKTVTIEIFSHLIKSMATHDPQVMTHPMNVFYEKYKTVGGRGMPHFGEPVSTDSRFTWVVRPEGAKKVLLFFHGGGYALPMNRTQFVGIMGAWYALDREKRQGLAVASLDYHLTCYDHFYPTQIFEAVAAYRELSNLGYEVWMIGDSCGANLALAVSRFAAYPEESQQHFSQFSQFAWDFSPLPPPRRLLLISPWVRPCSHAERIPGIDYEGDLGSPEPDMGLGYLHGVPLGEATPFVEFGVLRHEDHFARIPALNGEGATLVVYGEREIFRRAQEYFCQTNRSEGLTAHMRAGAVHDSMFYVEALDLRSEKGQVDMVQGRHRSKESFGWVAEFLEAAL